MTHTLSHDLLQQLYQEEDLRPLDLALATFLGRKGKETRPLVLLAAALISQASSFGHTCFDPQSFLEESENAPRGTVLSEVKTRIDLQQWLEEFGASPLVDNYQKKKPNKEDCAPLVLDENGLFYLRRYWQYETDVARSVIARTKTQKKPPPQKITPLFDLFFPEQQETDWQKIACALALTSSFSLITGGPGTGKTTTVVRLLAIMQALALQEGNKPLDIAMAAPTGKAAARLQESIENQLTALPALGKKIPWTELLGIKAQTLHSLLGARPVERTFKKNATNQLPYDIILIDEASMLDLELLHALLEATPEHARLILLGDKDQLASVEAGYVLGSLCARSAAGHYTPATATWLEKSCRVKIPAELCDKNGLPLDQSTVLLRKSYRFGDKSGIGQIASLVNLQTTCKTQDFLSCFKEKKDLSLIRLTGPEDKKLEKHVLFEYKTYMKKLKRGPKEGQTKDDWADSLLQAFAAFQLLTPLRKGPWGAKKLNKQLTTVFQKKTGTRQTEWFHGRPVLVTSNQPRLGLMNGDIGLTLLIEKNGEKVLRVAFPAEQGKVRWLAPGRLETIETAFVLTVHKAQGSEFAHCALVLPQTPAQVLSRELLYTAITRTKKHFYLFLSEKSILDYTLGRKLLRTSGLAQKIKNTA